MQFPPLPPFSPIRTTSFSQNTHSVNINSNSKVSTLTVPKGLNTTQSVVNFQRTRQNNLPYSTDTYNIQNQTRIRNF